MTPSENVAKRLLALRKKKGYSQEKLAELTNLNLRTIQRLEKVETEPRGDTLSKLADAFEVPLEDLTDVRLKEDDGFLQGLNLSGLLFLIFPILGVLISLIFWLQKRKRIRDVDQLGMKLINYQITLTIILFLGFIFHVVNLALTFDRIAEANDISPSLMVDQIKYGTWLFFILLIVLNGYNFIQIIINAFRISNDKPVRYVPAIPLLRN